MTHTVAVGEFKGPLGILLDLVERKKLEVTAISVAEITDGYLVRVKQLENISPEELSEFVQLGARLLHIKSLALLPPATAGPEQDEELQQLNLELAEYRRIQAAARQLSQRQDWRTWERQATERLEPADIPLPSLNLGRLAQAFTEALRRQQPEPSTATLRPHRVSLEVVMKDLRSRLDTGFVLQDVLRTCHNQVEMIVTFLALLELIRQGQVQVEQTAAFDSIRVEAVHG